MTPNEVCTYNLSSGFDKFSLFEDNEWVGLTATEHGDGSDGALSVINIKMQKPCHSSNVDVTYFDASINDTRPLVGKYKDMVPESFTFPKGDSLNKISIFREIDVFVVKISSSGDNKHCFRFYDQGRGWRAQCFRFEKDNLIYYQYWMS